MQEDSSLINCVHNGPARISGNFTLVLPDGSEQHIDGQVALCRCGMSEKMPFCDGQHKNAVPKHDDRLSTNME